MAPCPGRRAPCPPGLARLAALMLVALAWRAGGQGTPPPAVQLPAQAADSLPVFERPNGSLLRAGSLTYALSLVKAGGETAALGTRTVVVGDGPMGGAPGWLIAESRTGTAVPSVDSVHVARADLAPERWTASIGRSQLGASFTGDSVFGAVQTYQGRASFALAIPSGVLLSAGMTERVLEMLPLREGYRASAVLLLVEGGAPRLVPAEIVVERAERVTVAGGEVDAWHVALRWGASEQRLWIAHEGTRVVRTEQAVPGGVLVSTLLP